MFRIDEFVHLLFPQSPLWIMWITWWITLFIDIFHLFFSWITLKSYPPLLFLDFGNCIFMEIFFVILHNFPLKLLIIAVLIIV